MLVYPQKSSGYQYDLNHTLRWFFHFNPDLRENKRAHESVGGEEQAGRRPHAARHGSG